MALFVNHLTHLDVSIWSPEHGLTGMSWRVNATLEGEIGADGMLLDFGEVKPWIKQILDDGPDHTLLVPEQAEGVSVTSQNETCLFEATSPYPFQMKAPSQALTALPTSKVSEADILAHCEALLNARLPTNVTGVRLTLEAERIEGAEFGYSHGLKRHLGNCQRIAHGHRSRLEIHQHGERVPALEEEWSDWLQHRYLIEAQDIVEASPDDRVTCRYRATQGEFTLSLPKAATAILDTPTTIENIARWIAGQVAQQSGEPTRVVVFEGISKGATADAWGQ
ncbi:6-carboxytetrahydropterin synthase [Halomonas sp. LS-001]